MPFCKIGIGVEADDANLAWNFVDAGCAADTISLQLLDKRALGEGEPGLVVPVDVAAEPVLQALLDEAEAITDAVGLRSICTFTCRMKLLMMLGLLLQRRKGTKTRRRITTVAAWARRR